jgi:hypothetical protein
VAEIVWITQVAMRAVLRSSVVSASRKRRGRVRGRSRR